ncbi:NADPH-dependent F420 reductase [Streptococcus caviae]|uniref:NADPH-dependent F420 reductase n=1 Tax=Streptococcus sp. 'caviae' TaxID=1915004 RepID=UPI00094B9AD7|nr:NADPH-dependent F420 reductase [Streptococcus sp. 'caviae']OLN82323.1 diguanylate cyclase [Streptococcus sp. 'caviae']
MAAISIFGKGNMAQALKARYEEAGNTVSLIGHETDANLGDIVILAVPYPAVAEITKNYADALAGKILVDITNPLDFSTFDSLVVPADGSAAAEIAKELPNTKVLKAFNTTFAAHLATKKVADTVDTTVLVAGDDADAKATFTAALEGSGLRIIDAGSLKRARELEATGFLQLTFAVSEKVSWTGGFAILD